jgi:hypothetical protein
MANHQGTTITSRANPVAGNTIAILANLQTDINSLTLNSTNAASQGTQYTAWTGNTSQLANITTGNAWALTFTHRVAFGNASAARYFFNGAGTIKWQTSKTSTGQEADDEWNALATTGCGTLYIARGGTYPLPYTQSIGGSTYTGVTKSGGTGTPTVLSTQTGYYDFTTTPTTIYTQYSNVYGYTQNYITVTANVNSNTSPSDLTLTTTWNAYGGTPYHPSANITGGTATVGATFGTAPATLVTYFPPESTYLTDVSWGTPTVAATVANTTTTIYNVDYVAVGGGGAGGSNYYNNNSGGSGGGGAGGYLAGTMGMVSGYTYTITVGAGGTATNGNPGTPGSPTKLVNTKLAAQPILYCIGGGFGGGGYYPNGGDGGSGGGGTNGQVSGNLNGRGGLGVSGQGNNGGTAQSFEGYGGAGGGGALGAGGNGSNGAGGSGIASSITGSSVYRAGGGGGSTGGGGGAGGGTNGALGNAASATASTGGGGGGATWIYSANDSPWNNPNGYGGNGGSGTFILSIPAASYPGNANVTGTYSYSSVSGNIVLQWTSSGTYIA